MTIATSAREVPVSPPIESGSHHRQLARLRDLERQRRLAIVGLSTIGLILLLAGLIAVLDFYFEVSAPVRLLAWLGTFALLAGLIARLQHWRSVEAVDAVCQAERAWPEIGQRLRTSHDYQNSRAVAPANPELIRALEADTQQRVTNRVIAPLGRPWPILWLLGWSGAAVVAWLSMLVMLPDWRIATARLMFAPLNYSSVQLEPLPEHIPLGEDLSVKLHVRGRPLKSARVLYRSTGEKQWKEVALQPSSAGPLRDELDAVVPNCQTDLEIQIEAGPLLSGILPVAIRLPLVLEEWHGSVQPPAYTGLPTTEGSPEGLRVPEGSHLQLAAKYNRQPNQVDIHVQPQIASLPQAEIADSSARLSFDASSESMELMVKATASDGMVDDSSLNIEVVPDHSPQLKFVAPEEDAEAIPTAELQFSVQAFDDYGLGLVGIRYRIDDGIEQTLWESAPDELSSALAKTLTLPLEDLDIKYPQAITYYAYAVDNRHPEAQRVTSELRFVDIRPFSREYEFQDGECDGTCQGECLTLEKLIKEQRGILSRTFVATQQSQPDGTLGERLAAEQEALQSKTQSLAVALEEKLGPQPLLELAIESMSSAIEDLAAQNLVEGQAGEERALADLIAARQNLRKILKQSNSQSQMARNVDRQQMDKIRKPEREQEQDQEQQLAQIREQLEQLAAKQESFCQSAQACQQASSASSSAAAGSEAKLPGGQDGAPESNSDPAESELSATRARLAEQQQRSMVEARELERMLSTERFGQLAPQRVAAAAESIEQSSQSMAKNDDSQAIAKAKEAAEQFKRLAEHLGQRHSPDFNDKLVSAGMQAEQLAGEQQAVSESLTAQVPNAIETEKPATEERKILQTGQRQLVERAEELVDLVDQLQAESTQQDWEVQRALAEQASANPPRQALTEMQQAAQGIAHGLPQSAAANGMRAAELLNRFSAGLKEIQKALGPAQLEQLTRAEQQTAALLKDLKRATDPAAQAMVQARSRQLAESIRALGRGDIELTAAIAALQNPSSVSSQEAHAASDVARLASPPTALASGLRKVDQVLQRRIQEAILSGVKQQAVGAVPPQYLQMVDEYYRALSEDIE